MLYDDLLIDNKVDKLKEQQELDDFLLDDD